MTERPTIFARSTGALPSAIAIVRISGPRAGHALIALSQRKLPAARAAHVRHLRHPETGVTVDSALVLWFPGPDTATGEDLVELHLHGGRAVVAAVEAALASIDGLAPAEPGAFTRRAFENGRLDLSQVEGLADLLAAETERQRAAALVMAEGGLRRNVERWQDVLLTLAARAEAAIDFSDEDDVGDGDPTLPADIAALAIDIGLALANPPAERLRDGIRIGIAGPPNAGKSTLLNALVGREAAIVSPVAGTTRDVVEAMVDLRGIPVVFADMAGLRADAADPVEAIGIARAQAVISRSDILLWLGAPGDAPVGDHVLAIGAKSDVQASSGTIHDVSAKTGAGLDDLRRLIVDHAEAVLPSRGSLALSSAQRAHLSQCIDAMGRSAEQDDEVFRAEELRVALRALDRITGAAGTEAMLDTLFGRFCIGK